MPISDAEPVVWYDSHCHLNDLPERTAQMQAARQAGIQRWLMPGTDPEQWQTLQRLSSADAAYAIGLHPWFLKDFDTQLKEFDQFLSTAQKPPAAVGEIGLDYYFSGRPVRPAKESQIVAFEAQLARAAEYQLPVIIHCVKAHHDVIPRLRRYQVQGVVHAFNASNEVAQQYLDLGFYLGIGPQLLVSKKLQKVLSELPANQLLLETDAPYMAKTKEENPLLPLTEVGNLVSKTLGFSIEQLAKVTLDNANSLFRVASVES